MSLGDRNVGIPQALIVVETPRGAWLRKLRTLSYIPNKSAPISLRSRGGWIAWLLKAQKRIFANGNSKDSPIEHAFYKNFYILQNTSGLFWYLCNGGIPTFHPKDSPMPMVDIFIIVEVQY